MGEHGKPEAELGKGAPPPGNADGQVPPPEPGTGARRKPQENEDD
ncbi:hypothetical protein [Streptomyces spiramenti]|nr:hypothetical protein [Streptomyces spiramenti]